MLTCRQSVRAQWWSSITARKLIIIRVGKRPISLSRSKPETRTNKLCSSTYVTSLLEMAVRNGVTSQKHAREAAPCQVLKAQGRQP